MTPIIDRDPNAGIHDCVYGCGCLLFWNDKITDKKLKWCDYHTGQYHGYKECADILIKQGKNPTEIFKKIKAKKGFS